MRFLELFPGRIVAEPLFSIVLDVSYKIIPLNFWCKQNFFLISDSCKKAFEIKSTLKTNTTQIFVHLDISSDCSSSSYLCCFMFFIVIKSLVTRHTILLVTFSKELPDENTDVRRGLLLYFAQMFFRKPCWLPSTLTRRGDFSDHFRFRGMYTDLTYS